jgi:uncharacterized glyoxalase superfamily metalloenzyme YdcJ
MRYMSRSDFIPQWQLRAAFSSAMSDMYRAEVPAYGTLIDIVEHSNATTAGTSAAFRKLLDHDGGLERISAERHGAIRLGTAQVRSLACIQWGITIWARLGSPCIRRRFARSRRRN